MKRFFIYILGFIVFMFLVFGVYRYFSTGFLTVGSPNDSISKISTPEGRVVLESNKVKKLPLRTGSYVLSVSSKSFSKQLIIKVSSRKVTKITVNGSQEVAVGYVSNVPGSNMYASGKDFMYIDRLSGKLIHMSGDGLVSQISSLSFAKALWVDSTYGVLQDSSGGLHILDKGVLTSAQPVADESNVSITGYSLNPDKTVFVSYQDGSVYFGKVAQKMSKLIRLSSKNIDVVSGKKYVALISYERKGAEDGVVAEITVVDLKGGVLGKKSIEVGVGPDSKATYSWSPNGDYLALASGTQPASIYLPNMKVFRSTPNSRANNIGWVSNDSVVYSSDSFIWKYVISDSSSVRLASLTPDTVIYEVAPLGDSRVLVSSTYNDTPTVNMLSINTPSTIDNPLLVDLSVIMPSEQGPCSINYLNLQHLYVTVGSVGDDENKSSCMSVARNYILQQNGSLDGILFINWPLSNYESL